MERLRNYVDIFIRFILFIILYIVLLPVKLLHHFSRRVAVK